MNTSPEMSVLYEVGAKLPIPLEKRGYFHSRLRNRIYSFVLNKFIEKERSDGLTKAELARRIGRKPEVITRLLGAPGNWTLETISDLLLGIAGEELDVTSTSLLNRRPRNIDADGLLNHLQRERLLPIDPVKHGLASRAPTQNERRPGLGPQGLEQAA
jgi:hypothetical protein